MYSRRVRRLFFIVTKLWWAGYCWMGLLGLDYKLLDLAHKVVSLDYK